ncbi:MAG: hypothetical protein K6E97_01045, partial [Treponema sp.]|nr:hypothetical protein [Treponema sp.]
FEVYDENLKQVFSEGAKVEGGKAEVEWVYHWDGIKLDHKPKFTFKVTGARCKENESGELEISGKIDLQFVDKENYAVNDVEYKILCNDEEFDSGDLENGVYAQEDLIPGKYEVLFIPKEVKEKNTDKISVEEKEDNITEILDYRYFGLKTIDVSISKTTKIIIRNVTIGLKN